VVQDEPDGTMSTSVDEKQHVVDNKTVDTVQPLSNEHESQNKAKCVPHGDIKEHEMKTSEVKTEECNQGKQKEIDKNNSDKTKNSNQAPVAPPRRKKKNKKQPDKTQVNITAHHDSEMNILANECVI
jgi:hypothetical protein